MIIKKYKKIENLEFSFQSKMFFYSKDLLLNQDLIDFFDNLVRGKKVNDIIKVQENDEFIYVKNSKTIIIPSIYNFEKEILEGNKSFLVQVIKIIIQNYGFQNETLSTIKTLFSSLNLKEEFDLIKSVDNDIKNELELSFDTKILEDVESYISESLCLSFTNKFDQKINNETIDQLTMKKLYVILIKWLTKISDESFYIIFEDIFLGLDLNDVKEIQKEINSIDNFISISSYLPIVIERNLSKTKIIESYKIYDLACLINDPQEYLYFVNLENETFETFIFNLVNKWILNSFIYGINWYKTVSLSENQRNFLQAYQNRIF